MAHIHPVCLYTVIHDAFCCIQVSCRLFSWPGCQVMDTLVFTGTDISENKKTLVYIINWPFFCSKIGTSSVKYQLCLFPQIDGVGWLLFNGMFGITFVQIQCHIIKRMYR